MDQEAWSSLNIRQLNMLSYIYTHSRVGLFRFNLLLNFFFQNRSAQSGRYRQSSRRGCARDPHSLKQGFTRREFAARRLWVHRLVYDSKYTRLEFKVKFLAWQKSKRTAPTECQSISEIKSPKVVQMWEVLGNSKLRPCRRTSQLIGLIYLLDTLTSSKEAAKNSTS